MRGKEGVSEGQHEEDEGIRANVTEESLSKLKAALSHGQWLLRLERSSLSIYIFYHILYLINKINIS